MYPLKGRDVCSRDLPQHAELMHGCAAVGKLLPGGETVLATDQLTSWPLSSMSKVKGRQ